MEINPNFSENAKKDFVLVEAVKKGDTKAFERLMLNYQGSVYYMVLKMLNNREDANDTTQLTFTKAFENINKYKPDFAFSTWLFKIATNNAIDLIRKRKQNTISIYGKEENAALDLKCGVLNPEEKTIKKQQTELLKEVINNLPQKYLKIVTLRYFDEKSYDEITQILDIPIGTVKANLFRAREILSVILKRKQKNQASEF